MSLQTAILREGLQFNSKGIEWLNKAPLSEVKNMLDAHKSPRFIIIDTIQRSGLRYREFVDFMNDYPNKLFIVNSQADRTGNPLKSVAESLWYDADVKIRIEGFKAFINSRFESGSGTGKEFVINQPLADAFEAKMFKQ